MVNSLDIYMRKGSLGKRVQRTVDTNLCCKGTTVCESREAYSHCDFASSCFLLCLLRMSEQITQRESKNVRKIYHENGQFITILVLRISLICPSLHKRLRTGRKGCSLRVAAPPDYTYARRGASASLRSRRRRGRGQEGKEKGRRIGRGILPPYPSPFCACYAGYTSAGI